MGTRVLIVDDQADIRKLIRLTIDSAALELHEADHGEQAWHAIEQLRPALVILDIMMPGSMNGLDVCARVKQDPRLGPQTKIILLSAMAQRSDIALGKAAGCDLYMSKPFSPFALLDSLHQLLGTPA